MREQTKFIDAFVATVNITDSTLQNCNVNGVMIQITAASLYFMNMNMINMTTKVSTLPIIQTSLDGYFYMNNTIYTSSSAPLFNLLASSGYIGHLDLQNYSSLTFVIKFEQTTNATLEDWTLKNITITLSVPVFFSDAYIHSIRRMNFDTASLVFFQITKTRIGLMDSMVVQNSRTGPFYFVSSQIDMISNSEFKNNGAVFQIIGTINSIRCKAIFYHLLKSYSELDYLQHYILR